MLYFSNWINKLFRSLTMGASKSKTSARILVVKDSDLITDDVRYKY